MQGSKTKKWAEAIDRALHRESEGKGSAKWLDVLANRLVEAASDGDVQALKEVGDRIDGRPKATTEVTGADGGAIQHSLSVAWKK
jgi:hypothetical protein